jgi:hypothetical protein
MRAKHMPVRHSDIQFAPASRALLRAIGIGEGLAGALRVLEVARYCFNVASERTGEAAFAGWSKTAKGLEAQLRRADSEAVVSLDIHEFASKERDSLPARFAALLCPQSPSSSHQELSTLVACGVIAAIVAGQSIGSVLIPAMEKKGYPRSLAGAIAASSGELGVIIPPSIPMIVYALSANVSVADLFLAGVLPGLLIGGSLIATVYVLARIKGFDVVGDTSLRQWAGKTSATPACSTPPSPTSPAPWWPRARPT